MASLCVLSKGRLELMHSKGQLGVLSGGWLDMHGEGRLSMHGKGQLSMCA